MKEKNPTKTVLVAMTGGLESTVAAFLLKKQGYRCIGMGLQLFPADENPGPFEEVMISDLNRVKDICNYLDIPFYAVNASEIFADQVLDPTIGRVLSGQTFEPLIYLNHMLFQVLLEKGKKFQTSLVATGHYAKVLKNQKTGAFELMCANDLEHDQSYLLSRLEQVHLENLILPLSEIRKKEVEKIGELIKVDFLKRPKDKCYQLMRDPRMPKLVEDNSPDDLRKTGTIYEYSLESSVCEHTGIHHFYVGKNNLLGKGDIQIDPLKQVISIVPFKANIFIDYPDRLKYQQAAVTCFTPAKGLDMSLPMSAYVKMSPKGEKHPCRIYFKNNQMLLVDFDQEQPGLLVTGSYLVFYNRQNDKGKILGSGLVDVAGVFDQYNYHTLPSIKEDQDEEEETSKPVNNNLRF